MNRGRRATWCLILLLILAGFVRRGESTTLNARQPIDTGRNSGDAGPPKEFSMQAWLLFDPRTNKWPAQDSSHILRRITPKSVFIAPVLPACAEGYQEDTMHRCMKNTVAINTTFHLPFLLKRLEQIYNKRNGDTGTAAGLSGTDKQSSGPLQLNIPLAASYDAPVQDSVEEEHEETGGSVEIPIFAAPDEGSKNQETKKQDQKQVLVTVYEVKNDTEAPRQDNDKQENQEHQSFFRANATAQSYDREIPDSAGQAAEVVRITEFLNDDGKVSDATLEDERQNVTSILHPSMSNETVPTLPAVLLLLTNRTDESNTETPKVIPSEDAEDFEVSKNRTTEHLLIKISNITINLDNKENVPEVEGLSQEEEVDSFYENPKNQSDGSNVDVEVVGFNDTTEPNIAYDDAEEIDYPGSTDLPDEESTEADVEEILKHGEAGMTIPVGKGSVQGQRQKDETQEETTEGQESDKEEGDETESTEPSIDKVVIRFNDSASAEKDEAGSNVSSEVSINGDFILETTLLDVNTGKNYNTTAMNDAKEEEEEEEDEENEEDLEEVTLSPTSQPETILSSEDTYDASSTSIHNRKRTEQAVKPVVVFSDDRVNPDVQEDSKSDEPKIVFPDKYPNIVEKDDAEGEEVTDDAKSSEVMETEIDDTEDSKSSELMTASSSAEALLYDLHPHNRRPQDLPITEIHTIDESPVVRGETKRRSQKPTDLSFLRNSGSNNPIGNFRPTPVSFRPLADYVTFPSESHKPTNSPSSYVKFPAEEANSILSQDYKDRLQYPLHEFHSTIGTKGGVTSQRQPPYWWVSQNWRTDRLQAQQVQPTTENQRAYKNRPMLWRFWTRMPLVRDPSLYSTDDKSHPGGYGTHSARYLPPVPARRFNFYKEMSPQDVNRILAQKSGSSIGG